jgi:hypothetical protein
MQVRMALTPNSFARRKSGVQIPSPPPPTLQVRASSASSGRRSQQAAAALRPHARAAIEPGKALQAGRPRLHAMTTERSRRSNPTSASGATPHNPPQRAGQAAPTVVAGLPDEATPADSCARPPDAQPLPWSPPEHARRSAADLSPADPKGSPPRPTRFTNQVWACPDCYSG